MQVWVKSRSKHAQFYVHSKQMVLLSTQVFTLVNNPCTDKLVENAAKMVQSAWRRSKVRFARRLLKLAREERQRALTEAAIVCQRIWKNGIDRRKYKKQREEFMKVCTLPGRTSPECHRVGRGSEEHEVL